MSRRMSTATATRAVPAIDPLVHSPSHYRGTGGVMAIDLIDGAVRARHHEAGGDHQDPEREEKLNRP